MSRSDALNLARGGRSDCGENRRNERPEVLQAIGCGMRDDDTEWERRDWLLELDAAVHRDQDIVVAAHPAQKLAILDSSPRPTTVSTSWPARSKARSTGRCSSRRTRTGQKRFSGKVECGDGLFALHGRKLVEKFIKSLAAFQMIEERLNGHSRADKDRRSAEDVRIAMDDLVESHHMDLSIALSKMSPDHNTARTYILYRRTSNVTKSCWAQGLDR